MSVATYSPALTLAYAWALMYILMGIRWKDLSSPQRICLILAGSGLAIFNHLLRLSIGAALYGKMTLLTMHLPTFFVFFLLTRREAIKIFFLILSVLIFTAPSVIVCNLILRRFGYSSILHFSSNLLVDGLTILLVWLVFRKGFQYLLEHGSRRSFWLSTLVPFLYYLYFFAIQNVDLSTYNSLSGYVMRYLPTINVFAFYLLLMHNYQELSTRYQMEITQASLNQHLNAARDQIRSLNASREQTALYRHDMRHHLSIIEGFLSTQKLEQATAYIHQIQDDIDAVKPLVFCENEIINLLCSSFTTKADQAGIRLKIHAALPNQLSLSDTELCSMVSNGLENALHAVSSLPTPRRWIDFYADIRSKKLLLQIKNPCEGDVLVQDGLPTSSLAGHGYGCRSIHTIATQNDGQCTFEVQNGIFVLRIVLPLKDI